jgi:uncharacterized integral membrane protein
LSDTAHSAGSTLRRAVAAIILIPLAIVIIAFGVANRERVSVSLDPFSSGANAAYVTPPVPLFVLLIAVLIMGVIVGGIASWLRQTKWRRTARRLEREVSDLRAEVEALKRNSAPVDIPKTVAPPDRLKLSPPVR